MGDDPNLISKKDLLDQSGISYGQLYRWKRKGLIPESWFQKKSAFTGQDLLPACRDAGQGGEDQGHEGPVEPGAA